MAAKSKAVKSRKVAFWLGIVAGVVGIVGTVAEMAFGLISQRINLLVPRDSAFYCSEQADPSQGGRVWTVMYRNQSGTKPWLRMVRSMGGDFDPKTRCEEIADRLNIFAEDGLLGFEYRPDPNTPKQFVLCAKTTLSEDNCPLVLTLMPEDDPYESLREVAGALLPGNPASYQSSGEITQENPTEIDLTGQL